MYFVFLVWRVFRTRVGNLRSTRLGILCLRRFYSRKICQPQKCTLHASDFNNLNVELRSSTLNTRNFPHVNTVTEVTDTEHRHVRNTFALKNRMYVQTLRKLVVFSFCAFLISLLCAMSRISSSTVLLRFWVSIHQH